MWKLFLLLLVVGCGSEEDEPPPPASQTPTISYTLSWPHAAIGSCTSSPDCEGTCGSGTCTCGATSFPVQCCSATSTLRASTLDDVVAAFGRCDVEQVSSSIYTVQCAPDAQLPLYKNLGGGMYEFYRGTQYPHTDDFPCSWAPPYL